MGRIPTLGGVLASAVLIAGATTDGILAPASDTTATAADALTDITDPLSDTLGALGMTLLLPPATVTLSGNSVEPKPLDRLSTRSGIWAISDLGSVGDAHAYLWRLSTNRDFVRITVCRRTYTKEAGDGSGLSLQSVPVEVTYRGRDYEWNLMVAQGACRVAQNMEPVAPRPDWIRQAVANGAIPAYRRERAYRPALFKALAPDPQRGPYDPTSLGGSSSNNNYIGVTSPQGGEYTASRGFLHDADARVVDAALHNEDDRIAAVWSEFTAYTFYSLSQPQGAAWSMVNHTTVDPQFPQPGDRAWETSYPVAPNAKIDSLVPTTNWSRDVSHLENTGFIHWLATEDPIAGLLVQRQAAYALASYPENYRGGYGSQPAATTYRGYDGQERGLFNTLSALWKSRNVARRVASSAGTTIWSLTRTEQQADEIIAYYDDIAARYFSATTANPADYLARITGILFGGQGTELYDMADGTQTSFTQTSAFMLQQYGKEPLSLWTKAGDQRVAKWFGTYARSLVVRMTVIGGARGIDSVTGVRGSGFPIGPATTIAQGTVPGLPPFSTDTGWGSWVVGLQLKTLGPRDSFNDAALHTTMQTEGLLLLAKDAGLDIQDLDTALANIRRWKSSTTSYRFENLQMMKHMSTHHDDVVTDAFDPVRDLSG